LRSIMGSRAVIGTERGLPAMQGTRRDAVTPKQQLWRARVPGPVLIHGPRGGLPAGIKLAAA